MPVKTIKRLGKPVHEQIIYQGGFPIRSEWKRGKVTRGPFLAYHAEPEFHYIKRGEGSYLIGNQNYPFHKNSLLAIRPNEIHCFIPDPESYIEKGMIIFDSFLVKNEGWLKRFTRKFPRHLCLTEKEATRIEIIINEIIEEKDRKETGWREIILLKLKEFIFLLDRVSVRKPPPLQTNPKISRIITFIEENFAQALTRDLIADKFAFSPDYLSRVFTKYTGLHLKQYIIQRRIVEAKRLLTNQPTLKVGLIPKKIGFKDFALFNRSFKFITGMTPSAYRTISHQGSR